MSGGFRIGCPSVTEVPLDGASHASRNTEHPGLCPHCTAVNVFSQTRQKMFVPFTLTTCWDLRHLSLCGEGDGRLHLTRQEHALSGCRRGAGGAGASPSFCRTCPRICTQTDCTRTLSLGCLYRQVPERGEKSTFGLELLKESCGEMKLSTEARARLIQIRGDLSSHALRAPDGPSLATLPLPPPERAGPLPGASLQLPSSGLPRRPPAAPPSGLSRGRWDPPTHPDTRQEGRKTSRAHRTSLAEAHWAGPLGLREETGGWLWSLWGAGVGRVRVPTARTYW